MSEPGLVADSIDGIPHPGECQTLVGHDDAVLSFLEQYATGKLHHAHLVTGAKGIGKASFAMRMASHLFRYPDPAAAPATLYPVEARDPIDGKIAARAHPNLLHMTRPWDHDRKRFKTQLTVDEVRETVSFFGRSRGEDGWRIAIVDSVDDMNASSSNALLKVLEEPPERTVFFVLSHSPAKVLPTIRSRCQQRVLKPLDEADVLQVLDRFDLLTGLSSQDRDLLGRLSAGSVRRAIVLGQEDGLDLYRDFSSICRNLQDPDWGLAHALADGVARSGKEDRFNLLMSFAGEYMERQGSGREAGSADLSVLARWAEVWEKTRKSLRTAEAYNLDKKQVVLNLFQDMGEAARA